MTSRPQLFARSLDALRFAGAACALTLGACSSTPISAPLPLTARGEVLPRHAEIRNWTILAPGVAGSGQPALEDFTTLRERGYSTVINLRRPGESYPDDEQATIEGEGMAYYSLPMSGAGLDLGMASELGRILDEAPAGNVLIHCGSGNRVGALWGMYRGLEEGLSANEAVEAGRRAGMRSDSLAQRIRSEMRVGN